MADPVTLMVVAAGVQALGSVVQARNEATVVRAQAEYQAAQIEAQSRNEAAALQAQASQFESQANAAQYNAQIQRQQAETIGQQTSMREDLQRKQARAQMAAMTAAGAQSGVDITQGSAIDVFRQSLYDAEMDALNVRYEGDLNRTGMINQASLTDWEGAVAGNNAATSRSNADVAVKAGLVSAEQARIMGRANAKQIRRAGNLNAVTSLAAAVGAYGLKGMGGGGSGLNNSALNTRGTSSTAFA